MQLSKISDYLSPLLVGKKVAILGFGREGQSTLRLLQRLFPTLSICVLDMAEKLSDSGQMLVDETSVELFLGKKSLQEISSVDVIFKSPGVSPYLLEVQDAISRGAIVTSQTDVFFGVFSDQIIAVTGTKGKSTASQSIHQVLEYLGKHSLLLGNIGSPAFDSVQNVQDDTIIVYETSSHQSEGLRHSPHIGVFLNLFVDHLDYYPSMEQYAAAKRQLFAFQKSTDLCIYNGEDGLVHELLTNVQARKVSFTLEPVLSSAINVSDEWIVSHGEKIIKVADVPLLGKHNLLNIMPAIAVAEYFGFSADQIQKALMQVTSVKGRLETVATFDGIRFIDDALATIPEATIAALEALGDQVTTLIVGGYDRGQDFDELARSIANSGVKNLILFPTTGEKIAQILKNQGSSIQFHAVKSMKEAVKIAFDNTDSGRAVLLSTAAASFGLFEDYRDRSEQYYSNILEFGRLRSTAGR